MRIFRHIADVPEAYKGAVVAIGNFDGVHLGHQALIGEAARLARANAARRWPCLVFEPRPQEYFRPGGEPFRLTPFRAKAQLIAALGVDAMFALAFDAEMANRSAQDFVFDVLVKGLEAGCVVVGADFRFGKGRAGDAALFPIWARWKASASSCSSRSSAATASKISSTCIRTALKAGKPEEAARLLGHPFTIEGARRAWRQARPRARLSHRQHADRRLYAPGFRDLCGARRACWRTTRSFRAMRASPISASARCSRAPSRCWKPICSISPATSMASTCRWS